MTRATTAYVSGSHRGRTVRLRRVRGESGPLTANFNGALPAGETIASVTWRCDNPWALTMAGASLTDRESSVNVTAQWGSGAVVKCQVTGSAGTVMNQVFVVCVQTAPWFRGETTSPVTGPYELTVTA